MEEKKAEAPQFRTNYPTDIIEKIIGDKLGELDLYHSRNLNTPFLQLS